MSGLEAWDPSQVRALIIGAGKAAVWQKLGDQALENDLDGSILAASSGNVTDLMELFDEFDIPIKKGIAKALLKRIQAQQNNGAAAGQHVPAQVEPPRAHEPKPEPKSAPSTDQNVQEKLEPKVEPHAEPEQHAAPALPPADIGNTAQEAAGGESQSGTPDSIDIPAASREAFDQLSGLGTGQPDHLLLFALQRHNGNVNSAAEALLMSADQLRVAYEVAEAEKASALSRDPVEVPPSLRAGVDKLTELGASEGVALLALMKADGSVEQGAELLFSQQEQLESEFKTCQEAAKARGQPVHALIEEAIAALKRKREHERAQLLAALRGMASGEGNEGAGGDSSNRAALMRLLAGAGGDGSPSTDAAARIAALMGAAGGAGGISGPAGMPGGLGGGARGGATSGLAALAGAARGGATSGRLGTATSAGGASSGSPTDSLRAMLASAGSSGNPDIAAAFRAAMGQAGGGATGATPRPPPEASSLRAAYAEAAVGVGGSLRDLRESYRPDISLMMPRCRAHFFKARHKKTGVVQTVLAEAGEDGRALFLGTEEEQQQEREELAQSAATTLGWDVEDLVLEGDGKPPRGYTGLGRNFTFLAHNTKTDEYRVFEMMSEHPGYGSKEEMSQFHLEVARLYAAESGWPIDVTEILGDGTSSDAIKKHPKRTILQFQNRVTGRSGTSLCFAPKPDYDALKAELNRKHGWPLEIIDVWELGGPRHAKYTGGGASKAGGGQKKQATADVDDDDSNDGDAPILKSGLVQ